jgi:putative membrane protein
MLGLTQFLTHWGLMSLALWVASFIFHGITFENKASLFVAALLLGLANAIVRPVFILFTFPLTLITFGLFLLVINALMLLLVAALVKGFKVSGFWTAFFASIFISIFNFFVDRLIFQGDHAMLVLPTSPGVLI